MAAKGNVLDRILAEKAGEIARLARDPGLEALKDRAAAAGPTRDFAAALAGGSGAAVIAEIKKASPSAGAIRQVDPAERAAAYEKAGAAAISVLTDGPFFGGCLDDLVQARAAVGIPVLRKDFIVDPLQVYEARAAGADAILLIVAALSPDRLAELYRLARGLGLGVLVEVHQEAELEPALALSPDVLGINNRDLTTLKVSLETGLELLPKARGVPVVVAESGIGTPRDLARLRTAGFSAFLIGSSLMQASDPAALLSGFVRVGEMP